MITVINQTAFDIPSPPQPWTTKRTAAQIAKIKADQACHAKRWRHSSFFASILAILTTCPASYASGQGSGPVEFVLAFNHAVSVQMESALTAPAERQQRFAKLVDAGLDFNVIGRRVLGWRWSRATPLDQDAFKRGFRNYLIQTFATKVVGVDDGRMVVTGVYPEGDTVLVSTEIVTREGSHLSFGWRVTNAAGIWRLCDIVVKNLSMDAVMRSQLDSVLSDEQVEITPIIRLLQERAPE